MIAARGSQQAQACPRSPAAAAAGALLTARRPRLLCRPAGPTAMSSGRVGALVVATRQSQVVYERFYEAQSEGEKAEVRGAFDQVAGPAAAPRAVDDEELVGRFR